MRDWKKQPDYKWGNRTPYRLDKQQGAKQSKKKRFRISGNVIMNLITGLGLLSVILLITMFSSAPANRNRNKPAGDAKQQEQGGASVQLVEVLGVVTDINEEAKEITLYDIAKKESTVYPYSGSTDVTDKYSQTIAILQIPVGTMVEAIHPKTETKLTQLKISTKAWEYIGVNNLNIDRSNRVMKIGSAKYKYTDDLIILDGADFVTVYDLAPMDELTVRGYEETIWSITITRGHGTVKLTDYEGFIGDYVTIGYEAIQQIAKDMVIMVREGSFNLTVESAKYTATKNITVRRNQETVVSLGDLGPNGAKQGLVTFTISPFGADLFVDGKLTSYAEALEMNYGKHDIVVSLDGYVTYEGSLMLNTAGKNLRVDLPKESSNRSVTVTETDTPGTGTDVASNSGSGSGANAGIGNNAGGNGDTGMDSNIGTDSEEDVNSDSGESDGIGDDPDMEGDENPDADADGEDSGNLAEEDYIVDRNHLIYIQSPLGASVYLNGEFQGISPISFTKIIGNHVLTFIKEGYETISYSVEVANDRLDTYFNMPDMVKKQ